MGGIDWFTLREPLASLWLRSSCLPCPCVPLLLQIKTATSPIGGIAGSLLG